MDTLDSHQIIDRIRKVLALSTNPNQDEAENAALKAQELMLKYNVSLVEVEQASVGSATVGSPLGDISHEVLYEELDQKKDAWKGTLLGVVSRAFLCHALRVPSGFVIAGTEANRAIVKELFQFLEETLPKIARTEYQRYREGGGIYSRRTWSNSFYLGVIYSVRDKLDQQAEGIAGGTNLVLRSQEKAEDYLQGIFNIKEGKGIRNFAQRGYEKGYEAGKDLNLNIRRQLR